MATLMGVGKEGMDAFKFGKGIITGRNEISNIPKYMDATGDQNYMQTSGGAKLRSFDDSKGSIRAFMSLIANDEWYKDAVNAIDKGPQEMFKGMSVYAENPNYTNILSNVYKNRIEPIFQTENFLLPKRKPITEQMDSLQ